LDLLALFGHGENIGAITAKGWAFIENAWAPFELLAIVNEWNAQLTALAIEGVMSSDSLRLPAGRD
jgi:hypothetical protein